MNSLYATTNVLYFMEALEAATIEDLLTYDPIAHAEKMDLGLGIPYKDTATLGMLLTSKACERKNALLQGMDDSKLTNNLDNYLRIIGLLGFKEVARFPFDGRSYGEGTAPKETFFMFAHEEHGIILSFDTYNSDRTNGGHFYYNWKPKSLDNYYRVTSSGGFIRDIDKRIWAGNHDCREAIVLNISRLKEHGTFVKPWVETPFMWLVGYNEYSEANFSADAMRLTKERIKLCPDWVKR